jgi:hypothetical protein
MNQIRIRWLLTACTNPSPARDRPPCRSRVFASGERGRESRSWKVPAVRHDGWRGFLYDAPFWLGRERIEFAEAEVARLIAADLWHSARGISSPWPAAPSFEDGTKRGETTPECAVRIRSRATWLVRASIFRRSPPRPLTRGVGLVQSAYQRPARATASQASFDATTAHPPVSLASCEIVRINKTKQLGAACSEPL